MLDTETKLLVSGFTSLYYYDFLFEITISYNTKENQLSFHADFKVVWPKAINLSTVPGSTILNFVEKFSIGY